MGSSRSSVVFDMSSRLALGWVRLSMPNLGLARSPVCSRLSLGRIDLGLNELDEIFVLSEVVDVQDDFEDDSGRLEDVEILEDSEETFSDGTKLVGLGMNLDPNNGKSEEGKGGEEIKFAVDAEAADPKRT